MARLVEPVEAIVVLPEAVMDPIHAHLDEHEEVPGARAQEVLDEREALLRHLVDLVEDALLLIGAELLHVEDVLADELLHLPLERRRVRVGALRVRGEEAGHHLPVHRPRGVGLGDAHQDHVLAGLRQEIPDTRLLHARRVGDHELLVGVVAAVAEAVEAELPRSCWRACWTRRAR
jgi:hypothetical protein